MRFKKGSKVEVLCESEVPSGAWRCAEIVFGNGHNYTVKFDHSMGRTNETVVDRVPRKAIRPCPPPVGCEENWVAGAVVEVFHDFSWKSAIVLKVLVAQYYLVRLLGSSREFEIHKVKMRVRQCWHGNKWIVIGKGPWSSEVVKSNKISTLNPFRKTDLALMGAEADVELQAGRTSVCINNTTDFQESQILSVRKLKRASPFDCSSAEAGNRCIKKVRVIAKDSETKPCSSGNPSSRLNKVDAVVYPRENLGETYMVTTFNNQPNAYYEMEREKLNSVVEFSHGGSIEDSDSDSDICSIGSCSVISYRTSKSPSYMLAGFHEDADVLSSDGDSSYRCGNEEEKSPLPLKEDIASRIHRLELHAYRCTLEALYASGPLSWEQETLLTNLRITLHISNDEHLMEGQFWRHSYLASKGLKVMLGFTAFSLVVQERQYQPPMLYTYIN